jgi:hypothetical protein
VSSDVELLPCTVPDGEMGDGVPQTVMPRSRAAAMSKEAFHMPIAG